MRTWRLLSLAAVLTGVMPGTVISADTVKVFRYDGSLQCGMGQAVPLDEMAKELAAVNIKVLSQYFDPNADACGCASNQDKGRTHDGRQRARRPATPPRGHVRARSDPPAQRQGRGPDRRGVGPAGGYR